MPSFSRKSTGREGAIECDSLLRHVSPPCDYQCARGTKRATSSYTHSPRIGRSTACVGPVAAHIPSRGGWPDECAPPQMGDKDLRLAGADWVLEYSPKPTWLRHAQAIFLSRR